MAIYLIEIVSDTKAKCGSNLSLSHNKGVVEWSNLTHLGGVEYELDVVGKNVQGDPFSSVTITVEIEGEINPTKVFWAVVAVLKEVICPECL